MASTDEMPRRVLMTKKMEARDSICWFGNVGRNCVEVDGYKRDNVRGYNLIYNR